MGKHRCKPKSASDCLIMSFPPKPKYKASFALLTGILICFASYGQIGIGTGLFRGRDANQVQGVSAFDIRIYLPGGSRIFSSSDSLNLKAIPVPSFRYFIYNFKDNMVVDRQNSYTTFRVDSNQNHFYKTEKWNSRSSMRFSSIYLPIYFVSQPKKVRGLIIAPSLTLEYLVGGNFTRHYYDNNLEYTISDRYKHNAYYGMQRFQYGVGLLVNYKFLSLTGNYSITSIFKPNEGIDIHRFEVFLSLNFFWKSYPLVLR